MFKDKEEFVKAVTEVIASTVPELIGETMKALKKEEEEAKATADAQKIADEAKAVADAEAAKGGQAELTKTIEALKSEVTELKKKWDNGLITDPASMSEGDPKKRDPKSKRSVFAGLLTAVRES